MENPLLSYLYGDLKYLLGLLATKVAQAKVKEIYLFLVGGNYIFQNACGHRCEVCMYIISLVLPFQT